ncbi:MAG: right-handed parallel beta-helix repeat-containing protein, partial [Phycisphaerae bacterium]
MTHVCLNRIPRVIAAMGILAAGPALAGQIIYVDAAATGSRTGQSWESAFDNLQDALDRAVAGQEIWVAQGTYVPTARRDPANLRSASFALVNGVAVYGGFAGSEPARSQRNWVANRTVLSGDTFGDDGPNFTNITENTYHVVTAMGVESATVLDGVVITRGNATGAPGGDPVHGGGVFIVDASPSFQHCVFLENTGFLGGGAFVMADTQSRPTFVDCAFERNDTTLAGGDGGGLYTWESSSVTLIRCDFRGNTSGDNGGGVMHLLGDHLTAINCRFLGNVANGTTGPGVGGGAAVFRPAEFVNCTFVGNVADGTEDNLGGGGIYSELQSGPSSFFNCTFVANWAGQHGGGLFILHQPPVIANCIFWANIDLAGTNNNEAAQIGRFVEFGIQRPIPDHCTVQGWSGAMGGLGNIGLNPQFERGPDDGGDGWGLGGNDDFGDLRIGAGSPAIDAGNTQALPTNGADVDLAGAPRLMDDPDTPDTGVPDPGDGIVVDMGAHEYPHQCAGVACSDGNPCTVDDVCTNGRCQGVPLGQCACQSDGDCDDHIDCTLDACVGGDCLHTPNDGVCGDSLFCTGVEVCDAQIGCVSLGDPCPPGEFCNEITASCGICQSDANCDDGSDCTRDQCAGGACIFTGDPTVCPDDGLFCNGQERCDRVRGCLSAGNPCPSNTTCDEASNRCLACFTDADCDDGVDCTDDACVAGQCVTTRDDAACPDDGLFCNGAEFCDPLAGCVSVTNPCRPGFFCNEQDDTCGECAVDGDCSDGITCTVDQCVNGACRFVPDHTR